MFFVVGTVIFSDNLSLSRIVCIHNLGCFKSENVTENIESSFNQKFLNFVDKQVFLYSSMEDVAFANWTFEFVDYYFSTSL